ncbi:Hypothetical predicted protein [Pelobates cultripes]|uniref:Uncharacterized protein n=1 Tax=Pelobates cultripes TaxID=61616 RepID=A0AAD1SWT1_PELCU|nr:Hypothetical predicted protein [Pelobates cultripes]
MSHHKSKQKSNKSAFFAMKKQVKAVILQEGLEDGDRELEDSHNSCSLLSNTQSKECLLTTSLLQTMLDAQSVKLIAQFRSTLSDLKRDIYDIGSRTAHLESRTDD